MRTRSWPGAALAVAALFASLVANAAAQGGLTTIVVASRELPQTFAAEAVVEAVKQATLGAQIAGRVTALAVRAGDTVRAGQLLARIDARAADQVVAASLSQVAEAEANLANARRHLERQRALVQQKFVSQAAVDQAGTEFMAAQARLGALQSNAGLASTQQSFSTIVAPFAGVVGATHVEAGDMATPGRALLTLFEPGDLRVTATLPQAALARWKRDLPVAVELPAQGRTLIAKAATVVPLADPRTHTVKVRLDLPASDGLLPGQFARAQFPTGTLRALAVPAGALLRRGEVTAVYVIDSDGAPRLRQVRTGETLLDPASGPVVEILAGLTAGERIAAHPVAAGLKAAAAAR